MGNKRVDGLSISAYEEIDSSGGCDEMEWTQGVSVRRRNGGPACDANGRGATQSPLHRSRTHMKRK